MKTVQTIGSLFLLTLVAIPASAQSAGQKSFDSLKTLAGSWEGPVTTTPMVAKASSDGKIIEFEVLDLAGRPTMAICTAWCSRSLMPTITPRIGHS